MDRSSPSRPILGILSVVVLASLLPAAISASDAPGEQTLAAWDFDRGFEGWSSDNDTSPLLVGIGSTSLPSDLDPRRGWVADSDGRNGTPGIGGRRVDFESSSFLTSPAITVGARTGTLRLELWYRWDPNTGRASDRVIVDVHHWTLGGENELGWTRSVRHQLAVAELRRGDGPGDGSWQYLRLEVDVSGATARESENLWIQLQSLFDAPDGDCTFEPVPNAACNLDFTIDDVVVTRGRAPT